MGLGITFDNGAFNDGNRLAEETLRHNEAGRLGESWRDHFGARLNYLAMMVMQVVTIPLALINTLFCSIYSFVTWQTETIELASKQLLEKSNRFFAGFVGAFINPQIASNARHSNLPTIVGLSVLGGAIILPPAIYIASKVKINFWAIDSNGNLTLGYIGR